MNAPNVDVDQLLAAVLDDYNAAQDGLDTEIEHLQAVADRMMTARRSLAALRQAVSKS